MAHRVRLACLAIAALVLPALAACGNETGTPDSAAAGTPSQAEHRLPDSALPGELNEAGVALATGFTGFPVLWLGETFEGFNLSHVWLNQQEVSGDAPATGPYDNGDVLHFIYGDCIPQKGPEDEHESCNVPLQFRVYATGPVANLDTLVPKLFGTKPYNVRGITASDVTREQTRIWLPGGVNVEMFGDLSLREAAIAALQTANHDTLGIAPIEAGEPLDNTSWTMQWRAAAEQPDS